MAKEEMTPNDDEGVPDMSLPVGAVTMALDQSNGYGDPELDALERLEDLSFDDENDAGATADDTAVAALEERTERLAELVQTRHAQRVHRKVSAAVIGGGVAGAIPAVLAAVEGLELSPSVQPFVVLATSLIGLFVAAYYTPEREAPQV
jgi:hypothetical protein